VAVASASVDFGKNGETSLQQNLADMQANFDSRQCAQFAHTEHTSLRNQPRKPAGPSLSGGNSINSLAGMRYSQDHSDPKIMNQIARQAQFQLM